MAIVSRGSLFHFRAHRIALIKPSALGDIVHSLPIAEALRVRFPKSHITWVVNQSYQSLLVDHPAIDAVLPFDRGAMRRGIWNTLKVMGNFLKNLRKQRFDLVVDLQGLLRTGLMTWATAARTRIGLGTAREGSRHSYTDIIPTPDAEHQHAIDRYWLIADALGVGHLPKVFRLAIPSIDQQWANRELESCPRPWAVFAVGSRWLTKRWPPEHFAVLAERMQRDFGGTALFIGTADESELAQRVMARLRGPARDYSGRTTLMQLAALVQNADVMIGNDTGPLHLAAALGRRIVAPYTCTRIERHGPYQNTFGAVESSVWCQGSYLKQCSRLECMDELHPDRLWYFLREILHTWSTHSRSA